MVTVIAQQVELTLRYFAHQNLGLLGPLNNRVNLVATERLLHEEFVDGCSTTIRQRLGNRVPTPYKLVVIRFWISFFTPWCNLLTPRSPPRIPTGPPIIVTTAVTTPIVSASATLT
jgi:hypothetical protein